MTNASFVDKGIIKKIYLKDFMTYSDVVFTPGRNLNLLIGPNGTGKSTIVSAIALGLGASHRILGKNVSGLSQYVRNGCQSAIIEIDLVDTPNKNIKFHRTIDIRNKSTWKLDGGKATEAQVNSQIERLNVQIENLCQFLPQEKVKEFSNLSSVELLKETERSVGDPKLYEYHMNLLDNGKKYTQISDAIIQKQTALDSHTQKCQNLEETVSHIKERKAISSKIVRLKQKKAWITYDQARKGVIDVKEKYDSMKKVVTELTAELSPIMSKITNKHKEIRELEKLVKNCSMMVKDSETKLIKNLDTIENLHCHVKDIRYDCKDNIKQEEASDRLINVAEMKKNKLENDLQLMIEQMGTEDSVNTKNGIITKKINIQREEIDKLNNTIFFYRNKYDLCTQQILSLEQENRTLSDVATKRLDILKSRQIDAYRGVLWLRENRDKFRSTVHEPMFLNINVSDVKYAKYFESIINFRDLCAFVCEEKYDVATLLKYLRDQQGLVINVVYSDPNAPLNTQSRVPIENIKEFGFYDYATAFIQAPDIIMKYLVNTYGIQHIPFGSVKVEDCIDYIPDNFRVYYSCNNSYQVRRSRYTGDKSFQITRLRNPSVLHIVAETHRINQNIQKIAQYTNDRTNWDTQLKEAESNHQVYSEKIENLRAEKHELTRRIQQIQTLKSQVNRVTAEVQKLCSDRKSIEDIKKLSQENIVNILYKQLELFKNCSSENKKVVEIITQSKAKNFELKLAEQELEEMTNNSRNMQDRLVEAKHQQSNLEKNMEMLRNEAKKYQAAALELTNHINPNDPRFAKYQKAFSKLPYEPDEIEEAIRTASGRLYCMADSSDAERILAEYDETKKNVEILKNEIGERNEQLEEIKSEIETVRNQWIPMVNALQEAINTKFTEYFSSLGCVGEVALRHGNDPMNFEQYEFKISVKFRDTDDLQEFNRQRQSGGERAVTTAIYMLSLQPLCRVPFRVVDEINQGMDAIYERKIFDLLVQITSQPTGSQYFLITPKLLPNLKYNDYSRVHVVHNGPYVISHNQFNLDTYCRRLAEKENV